MNIGVKYCGGCNPRYERGMEFKGIKQRHPDISFESYDFHKEYDKVLLICGCDRICLKFRPELAKENAIVVGSSEECRKISL